MEEISMVAAPTASWSHILTQVAESLDRISEKPSAEILMLKPTLSTFEPSLSRSDAEAASVGPSPITPDPAVNDARPASDISSAEIEDVADWMSTLDIINGMAGIADDRKKRLNEQSVSHDAALQALKSELTEALHLLRLSELRAHENQARADIRLQKVQADADAQVQAIRAEAEARVRTIRAETDAWIRATEEQARVADLRADTAEKWLQRIDTAAKNLLLGGHMNSYSSKT
ncbi:cell division protein DivIVA [Methylobacterium sp. WL64]|uniref:cell division protein DivIVA n=1 Tax=Methylobacterium sp. WL64 TaxID=2603894 RepID=UPI001FEEA200|nr:cell division protein DivIVA [Methylobacterium sp. WL64]